MCFERTGSSSPIASSAPRPASSAECGIVQIQCIEDGRAELVMLQKIATSLSTILVVHTIFLPTFHAKKKGDHYLPVILLAQ